jgi:hypothetical protein
MAAELWANDNGAGRKLKELWVNDAGVARKLREVWVNDSGVARCIFRGETVSLNSRRVQSFTVSPTNPGCLFELNSDGFARSFDRGTLLDAVPWVTPQAGAASFECFATVQTGAFSTGTFGIWLPLSSTRQWTLTRTGIGNSLCSMTLQIRRIGESEILTAPLIELEAEKETSF